MTSAASVADVHRAILDLAGRAQPFALATVLHASGSTPCKAGAKALVDASGATVGTVGGGAVEAEAQRRAVEAIGSGRPLVFDFALEGGAAADCEPICGGVMQILVDPTAADHRQAYNQALQADRTRRSSLLVTSVHGDPTGRVAVRCVDPGVLPAALEFLDPEALHRVLARGTCELFVTGNTSVFVEPLIPPPILVIAGGGHIGQALALQAHLVGFAPLVIDDRPEFTDPALYPPGTATRCGDIASELAALTIGADTYIAIVTRSHRHDRAALAACVRRPAAYIGMIGSRRKVAMLRRDLLDAHDADEQELDRLYAPIGLDIGARTVPEIAASIVAQLIAVRRRGDAPHWTPAPTALADDPAKDGASPGACRARGKAAAP